MFLFVIHAAIGQAYKEGFKNDLCHCLEEESLKRKLTDNAYKVCFRQLLPKYATQIDAAIIEEDPSVKYYKGQVARKDLIIDLQYQLVYSCELYYQHLNAERLSKRLIAQEHAKAVDLELYNQQVALTPNALTYFMRAQVHFNLGHLKETEADIERSIAVNPNKANVKSTRHELLLLAWVYEEQERFSEAVSIYDTIYLGDFDSEVAILRALAHKKSGGTTYNKLEALSTETHNSDRINRRSLGGRSRETPKGNSESDKRNSKVSSETSRKKQDSSSLRKLFKIDN